MLPYRLRHPAYGGKLKKEKTQEEKTYKGGGPVQQAIQRDLLSLRSAFDEQIHQLKSVSNIECKKGASFGVFHQVFTDAKVSLLHTRLAPNRCDAGAFAQLIYATCFSMLHHEFKQNDVSFSNAVYSAFCLYALYETSPLPHPTGDLRMLPMGIHNRDNPKLTYRRNFKSPIRIDQNHYVLLLKLKDLALAKKANCQANQSQQLAASLDWQCQCILATDVLAVLDRLAPNLEFCEYTGPCGLEGLAGHEQYPFPAKEQAKSEASVATTDYEAVSQEELDTIGKEFTTLSESLQVQLGEYISNKRAIRLPALSSKMTQQSKRVREALVPIFDRHDDPLSRLSDLLQGKPQASTQSVERHVTFGSVVGDNARDAVLQEDGAQEGAEPRDADQETVTVTNDREDEVAPQESSYELVLPRDLPTEIAESIKGAVRVLVERDAGLLLPKDKESTEDLSTIGQGGVSVASTVTGVGGNALKSLLAQVKRPDQAMRAVAERPEEPVDFFLGGGSDESTMDRSRKHDEELSDLSDDDGGLAAKSAIGRASLKDLLSLASRSGAAGVGKPRRNSTNGKRRLTESVASPRRKRPRPRKEEEEEEEEVKEEDLVSESLSDEDDGSTGSQGIEMDSDDDSEGQGNMALNVLLSKALG